MAYEHKTPKSEIRATENGKVLLNTLLEHNGEEWVLDWILEGVTNDANNESGIRALRDVAVEVFKIP